MKTREKILRKALEMFNEKGIEYVGLRELANVLNIRVGNITYYFPTKDDLVNALSLELNALNSELVLVADSITLGTFMQMIENVFHNHIKYRCLLLSFVHLMEQNKVMALRYKQTENYRNASVKAYLQSLDKLNFLNINSDRDLQFLVSTIALIVRFWISEAAVSHQKLTNDQQIEHYLSMIAMLFKPYTSDLGRPQIEVYFR